MTPDLSNLVTQDGRRPIEKLRRVHLWAIARRHGIPFPEGASKEKMIKILEGQDIDVTRPDAGLKWRQTVGRDENEQPVVEIWPEQPAHASAGKNIDYAAAMEAAKKKREEQDDEIAQLRAENASLKAMLEERLVALESRQTTPELVEAPEAPKPAPITDRGAPSPLWSRSYPELKKLCAQNGIKAVGKKPDLIQKLEAAGVE